MAASRRLRFEILRRDGHTCRYCGAMAPDVKLTVDHVVPVALGGSDEPTNLVAACADCNAGKSSIAPGSEVVADVEADALRWARAIEAAGHNLLAERELIDARLDRFEQEWHRWTFEEKVTVPPEPVEPTGDVLVDNWHDIGHSWWVGRHSKPVAFSDGVLLICVERGYVTDVRRELAYSTARSKLRELLGADVEKVEVMPGWTGPLPEPPRATTKTVHRHLELPAGWRGSVERFYSLGLPEDEIKRFVTVTMERPGLARADRFRFFCGCCWRTITDLQEDARRIVESEAAGGA